MFVKDIMTKEVISVSPETSLKELGEIFKAKRISGTPVVDENGKILGIVTLTDLLRILDQIYKLKELEKRITGLKLSEMREEEKTRSKAKDIMNKDVCVTSEDNTIDDVMRMMFSKGIHTIPVVRDGKIVGIIGKRDVVYACF